MTVQAKDFMFNGVLLSSLNDDYKLVSFDTSPSDTSVNFMDNKVEMSDINYNSPVVHFYNSTAKNTLEFDIMISKQSGEYLTQSDIYELSSWLTSPVSPKVLSFVKYLKDDGTAGDRCDRTFIDAVLTGDGSKILSPYADAVKTLAFVLACNQSIEEKRPVTIDWR